MSLNIKCSSNPFLIWDLHTHQTPTLTDLKRSV